MRWIHRTGPCCEQRCEIRSNLRKRSMFQFSLVSRSADTRFPECMNISNWFSDVLIRKFLFDIIRNFKIQGRWHSVLSMLLMLDFLPNSNCPSERVASVKLLISSNALSQFSFTSHRRLQAPRLVLGFPCPDSVRCLFPRRQPQWLVSAIIARSVLYPDGVRRSFPRMHFRSPE